MTIQTELPTGSTDGTGNGASGANGASPKPKAVLDRDGRALPDMLRAQRRALDKELDQIQPALDLGFIGERG